MSDIKSYCGSDFGAYVRYIEEVREISNKIKAPYIDPDKTYDDAQSKYYIELTKFLNKQEEKYIDEEKRWKYIFENNKDEPDGIKVKKNGETLMVLKSDQLGFSAIHEDTVGKLGHLYYRYLSVGKDVDVIWLAKCIWSTRTIGGGFVWPINKIGRKQTIYNLTRGRWLEDRVDLTLMEIKHYYDWVKNDKIKGHCFECDKLHTAVCNMNTGMNEWLEHFKTFENYVDFFALCPFVEKKEGGNGYIPINIIESNISQSKHELLKELNREKVIINIMDPDKLEEIIDNICQLIKKKK